MPRRKPASFIVARHLLTHPTDGTMDLVRHTAPTRDAEFALDKGSVSKAIRRLEESTDLQPRLLLEAAVNNAERPRWKEIHLHMPEASDNQEGWHSRVPVKHWFSGELAAAALDQIPVFPTRLLVYVRPEDLEKAVRFTIDEYYARLTDKAHGNLTIRAKDPWIYSDEQEGGGWYVEKGQRLIDYRESKNVHLLEYSVP